MSSKLTPHELTPKKPNKMISDGVLYKKRSGRLSVLDSHFSWTPDGGSGQAEISVPYSLLKGTTIDADDFD